MCLQSKEFKGNGFQMLVKERAHELNFDMKFLAQYCEISYATLYNWIALKSPISHEKLAKLADALDLNENILTERYQNALAAKKKTELKAKPDLKAKPANTEKKPVLAVTKPAQPVKKAEGGDTPFSKAVFSMISAKKLSILKVCTLMMISRQDFDDMMHLKKIPSQIQLAKLSQIISIPCGQLEELIIRSKIDETGILISDLQKCKKYLADETSEAEKLLGNGLSIGEFIYHFEGMCISIWKKVEDRMMLKVMPVISIPDEKAMRSILTAEEWTSY